MRVLILPVLPLALSGCIVAQVADTAVDVVTLPVKAVSAGVDAATTSQSEADEKRGRELRKAEEKAGKEARERDKRCRQGKPLPSDDCSAMLPPPVE
jgi:hypothetical protein